ncbi:MAG: 3D domain-containing protein [Armatimonadota bacterium]|nr:3D domain-containing protein [Armatimonadota bacterium]
MRFLCLRSSSVHFLGESNFARKAFSCVTAVALIFAIGVTASTQSANQSVLVSITSDGQTWEYVSSQKTVGAILKEAGVEIGKKDRVIPSLDTPAKPRMAIKVIRIVEKIVVQKEPIAYKTITKFNPYSRLDRVTLQEGIRGEKEVTYKIVYKDGKKVSSNVIASKVLRKPQDEIVSVSRGTLLASRGGFVRCLRMRATAYAPYACGGSKNGRTACGLHAGKGIVAVDPRVIRLGTKLYVEGYGYCVAGDVGGAIKGNRIDLGFDTYRDAVRFGRRWVTVFILK